ncbi:MAG TPA: PAS domain-containing protein, partial [Kofleriaceae bacterium]
MAESLPHLVWGARPDGAFDFISRQWTEYTGIPDVEHLQWGWLDQVHPGERDRVRDQWRAALRTGARFDSEFRIRGHDGAYRWFKTRSVPIRDIDSKILRWYGTSTDVDELKRAEDGLAAVLAAINDGFIAVDKDLQVISVNPAAEQLLGRDAKRLVGHFLLDAVPELGDVEDRIRHAPAAIDFTMQRQALHIRSQRDHADGYWLFMTRGAS